MVVNLQKLDGVFDSLKCPRVNIIGTGSVGSSLAEMVARLGVENISLFDFDKVELSNMPNSALYTVDDGVLKVVAVEDEIHRINPNCQVKLYPQGYKAQPLNGIVFLAVDSIDLRKEIVGANLGNDNIKAMFDIRTSLYSAQGYAADWSNHNDKINLLKSMSFTHDEVEETRSACGAVLGVVSTVRMITAAQIANFVNFMNKKPLKRFIQINTEALEIESF